MAFAPEFNRKVGALRLPAPDTGEGALVSLDPGQELLLKTIKAGLVADLNARFRSAAQGTPLANSQVVESAFALDPSPDLLRTTKAKFPALFVYPEGSPIVDAFSLAKTRVTQNWAVDYILGPLEPTDQRRLVGILRAVVKDITQICHLGGHPAYAVDPSGTQPDQQLTDADFGGFSTLRFVSAEMGGASFAESAPMYWSASCIIETTEIDGPADSTYGTAPHTALGVDYALIADDESDPIDDFIEVESESESEI